MTFSSASVGSYAIADGLIGFSRSNLRVRITRVFSPAVDGSQTVQVCTADLSDAGTHLALDASQLTPFEETVSAGWQHRSGLVVFA